MMGARHRLSRRARLRMFWHRRVLRRQWWPPAAGQMALVFASVFVVSAGAMTMKVVPEQAPTTQPAPIPVAPIVVPAALPMVTAPLVTAPVVAAAPPRPIRHAPIIVGHSLALDPDQDGDTDLSPTKHHHHSKHHKGSDS